MDSVMGMVSACAKVFRVLQEDPALREALSKIRTTLRMSGLLIERSECWRFKCKFKVIDDLIPQLKDAMYEAQSILNEFTYQELKQRAEGKEGRSMSGVVSASQILTNIRNWCKDYPTKANRVLEWLVSLNEKLEKACDWLDIPRNSDKFSMTARPVTSSIVSEPKVFGRDKELDEVVRLLGVPSETINDNSPPSNNGSPRKKRAKISKCMDIPESSGVEKKENTSVLPIVGIGGVGKTTLAQMVYNTENVKSHFNLKIWICVSDNFDVIRLTKEIIECATGKSCDTNNLDLLQNKLKKLLKSKRFLLVLDDVWSESETDWHRLFGPLKEAGSAGSMIVVTTRSLEVAKIMGTATMGPLILEGLEEVVFWEFFKSCAFGSEVNSGKNTELERIGGQIVGKLKRSPLAAKTLGGLLNTDLNVSHWRNIRDSEMWELQQKEDGILPALQLSYQYLPSHLKKCFSFCSLFTKDYVLFEDELIWLWISEGFIASQQIRKMEGVAKGYLRELVSRCFFQEISPLSRTYKIHDLMHDVSQSITKDECFRTGSDSSEKRIISMNTRHLSIDSTGWEMDKLKEICKLKKLYTLKIHKYNTYSFNTINSWFSEMTNMCSLSLTNSKIKNLPDSIDNLKHLRYLDISGTEIEKLPNSFCNLYKLEILDMKDCKHFQCFPEGSNRLISMKLVILSHPDRGCVIDGGISAKVSLVGHIPNLANAIHQETLAFSVTKEERNTIGTLKHINGIYNMMLLYQLDNVSSKEEAEQAHLNNKEFLNFLCLSWSESTDSIDNDHDEAVLEGLCPHPNLKGVEIANYKGRMLHPNWLKTETLTNLTTIEILCCNYITTIPRLPRSVTDFHVKYCERLASLQDCLVPSSLPSLKRIEINGCKELVTMAVETVHEFIYLQHLFVYDCPKITCQREMFLPPSLQDLGLKSCGELEERFSGSLGNLTSLTNLTIGDCQRLTSIPLDNLKSLENLEIEGCSQLRSIRGLELCESVRSIEIRTCPELKSLELGNSKSLEGLKIEGCSQLQSIGGPELCESVRSIEIRTCPELKSLELGNPKSLEGLEIEGCSQLQSIGGLELPESVLWIKIRTCPELKSLELGNSKSLEVLEIEGCSQLRSIRGLELCGSVRSIKIRTCPELKPLELGNPKSLKGLEIEGCSQLQSIGGLELPESVWSIKIRTCPELKSLELGNSKSLEVLEIEGCSQLRSIRGLELCGFVRSIKIRTCPELKPLELGNPKSLKGLEIEGCSQLQSIGGLELPESVWSIKIRTCPELKSLELGNSKSLENLEIEGCSQLRSIRGLELCESVRSIEIRTCPELKSLELGNPKSLEGLKIEGCSQLQSIRGPELCESVRSIEIRTCPELKSLELGNPKSLERLEIEGCSQLQSIGGLELS
ncbi:hypothetical protein LUZ60_017395 [Juncus effusus]|nr:hypothetical protein LUZ60_017395 [Juncus effusus]